MPHSKPKHKSCYLCRFHHVYWEGTDFAGCECRGWDDPAKMATHHQCGGATSYSAARDSGKQCPRFAFFPPEEYRD